jgi:hypothetical protein
MSEQLKKELGYGIDLVVDGSDQAMLD